MHRRIWWPTLFVPDCRLPTNSMFTRRQYRLRSRKCPKVERLVLVTTRRFPPPWTVETAHVQRARREHVAEHARVF